MPEVTAEDYIVNHWKTRKVWRNLQAPKHQERLKKCAELCRGERLADMGCAFGHSTNIMQGFKAGNWSGFDVSSTAIKEAKEFFPDMHFGWFPNIGSLHNLARFSLDSIVCSEVLEHVDDDRGLVTGLWSAVKERAIFTTPSVKVNDPGHIRLYDKEMLETLFDGIPHTIENTGLFWYIVCDESLDADPEKAFSQAFEDKPEVEPTEADVYLSDPEDGMTELNSDEPPEPENSDEDEDDNED